MKSIIFGASGQDGFYLQELLRKDGVEAIGVARSEGGWLQGDVSDWPSVSALVRETKPDSIFQLAAISSTRHDCVFENHQAITTGTLNVLEAVKQHAPECRVFVAGSAVQFVNRCRPLSENEPFEASSAYAAARIQSVYMARYYRTLGMRVSVGYLFHHESPLRKPGHVSKLIAAAAGRIAAGSKEILELGDIAVRKEWTFAGDVAKAMAILNSQDATPEATIGSGISYSIEEWLEACFRLIGRDWREHVRPRPNFIAEYKSLVCDPATIQRLGWSPAVDFKALAAMMIEAEMSARDSMVAAGA